MSNLMDFNATIDLIIRELDEAREIIEDLKKLPGMPLLEIEIARSKCKNAAEFIAMLKEVKEVPAPASTPVQPSVPEPEKPDLPGKETNLFKMPDPIIIPAGDKQAKQVYNNEPREKSVPSRSEKNKAESQFEIKKEVSRQEEKKEVSRHEEKKNVSHAAKTEDPKDPGLPEIDETEKKPFVAPIIADTFSHLANRYNENLSEKQDDDFSFSHGRHYTSISDAIGVNDRFYYIREVFNGDREAYTEAISRLEKAGSTGEAREILKSYRKDAHENKASKELIDLVKRKFGPHE